MNYFLDSNVIISYIFNLDNLHENVIGFIEFESKHYYSENVKTEIDKVFKIKSRQYGLFLLFIWKFLNSFDDNDFVDELAIHGFVNSLKTIEGMKHDEMHHAINLIWDQLSFSGYHDAFEIKSVFGNFKNDFQSRHSFRKSNFLNDMILVPNHTKKDSKISEKIEEMNLRDGLLHSGDEEILFDVNKFCKDNRELDIKFVTGDQDFIKAIDILMEFLCLDECINIMEFSNC